MHAGTIESDGLQHSCVCIGVCDVSMYLCVCRRLLCIIHVINMASEFFIFHFFLFFSPLETYTHTYIHMLCMFITNSPTPTQTNNPSKNSILDFYGRKENLCCACATYIGNLYVCVYACEFRVSTRCYHCS